MRLLRKFHVSASSTISFVSRFVSSWRVRVPSLPRLPRAAARRAHGATRSFSSVAPSSPNGRHLRLVRCVETFRADRRCESADGSVRRTRRGGDARCRGTDSPNSHRHRRVRALQIRPPTPAPYNADHEIVARRVSCSRRVTSTPASGDCRGRRHRRARHRSDRSITPRVGGNERNIQHCRDGYDPCLASAAMRSDAIQRNPVIRVGTGSVVGSQTKSFAMRPDSQTCI